jgi:hypothetical protein
MNKVNYLWLKDSINLSFEGKHFTISSGDPLFEKVTQAIREQRLEDIPSIVDISKDLKIAGLELKDGALYDGETALPEALNRRILEYRDGAIPYDSLLKFWENVKKNPSFNSRQMLFSFLAHNGHPITEDGCFIAYRGVREDFKDKHSGTFDNSPGSVCEMPRDQVDDNPNNTCSKGLHVACFDYAKGFGAKLVEVKVNPEDVVAVPTDYNGTKMRVCKFEVIQECESMRTETLYNHGISREELCDDESDEDGCEDCGDCEDCDKKTLEDGNCPECRDDVESDDAFCKHCGTDLDQYRG